MLKIGEFSKLSHLTIKALRFYEKEGILMPAFTDEWTGYRFYETSQLQDAGRIKAYRQLGLTIDEIKLICSGEDEVRILKERADKLYEEKLHIDYLISAINNILEDKEMKYHVTEKVIPKTLVYYSETTLDSYQDIMTWIPSLGEECLKLNPGMKCAEPPYEFCEFLDNEYKETNIKVRHNEAVTSKGKENEIIKFREIPESKVISIFHKGAYENIGEAYSYIIDYAEKNGYKITDTPSECYIDGVWNKESKEDWLTEIQVPVE